MTSVLITGANKGLGLETARQLAGLGWTVHLGARDPELGKEVAASLDGDVRFVEIDVTSDESVRDVAAPMLLKENTSVEKPLPSAMNKLLLNLLYSYPPTMSNVLSPVSRRYVNKVCNVRALFSRSYWRATPPPSALPIGFALG